MNRREPSGSPLVRSLLDRCHFPDGEPSVTCAVSGGADSLALLALAVASGREVHAVHVDHGLREGSADEAVVVRAAALQIGATCSSVRVEVGDGPNLEARARAARYGALPPGALTGHTADDQAETVLLAILRGSGPAGLAGIDAIRRPLLRLRRSETVALCAEIGLEVVNDPSNDDRRFLRNRLRHEVLPLLREVAGRDVVPLLCRSADISGDLADLAGELAADVDGHDVSALRALPRAVAAEALRSTHRAETGATHPPDAAAIARLLRVVDGQATAAEVTGGWRVRRSAGILRWERVALDRTVWAGS